MRVCVRCDTAYPQRIAAAHELTAARRDFFPKVVKRKKVWESEWNGKLSRGPLDRRFARHVVQEIRQV